MPGKVKGGFQEWLLTFEGLSEDGVVLEPGPDDGGTAEVELPVSHLSSVYSQQSCQLQWEVDQPR